MKSALLPAVGSVLSTGCADAQEQSPVEHATWCENRALREPARSVTWKYVGVTPREAFMILSLSPRYALPGFAKDAYDLRASGDRRGGSVTIAYEGQGSQSPKSAAMEAKLTSRGPCPPEGRAQDTRRALSIGGHRGGRQ